MSHLKEVAKYLKLIQAKKLERNNKECIELYNVVGGIYSEIGSYDEAIHYHEQALDLCKTTGDRLGVALTFRYIGEAKAATGNFNEAIDFIKRYLELADKLKNKVETQRAYTTLGRVFLMQAQDLKDKNNDVTDKETKQAAREAEKRFQTALNLAKSVRNQVEEKEYAQMLSGLLINLGLINDICGQHSDAVAKFNRAMETCRTARLKEDLYRCQIILAGIHRQRSEVKLAVKVSEEALQTAKSIGKKILICEALIERGLVRICQRDFKNAKRTFAQAYLEKSPSQEDHSKAIRLTKLAHLVTTAYEKICKDSTPVEEHLKLCDKLGDLFVAIGNFKLAAEFYRRAYDNAKKCSKPRSELARILFSMAETFADGGQFGHALVCYEKELTYREGNSAEQCQSLIKIAHMHEYLEHEPAKITEAYEKALEKASEEPKLMHNVLQYYVPYMRQKGLDANRYRELSESFKNLKSYPEVIEDLANEDNNGGESDELEDEIANVEDVITDDEDNDEVLMIGRRRARGKNKFKINEVGETPLHEAAIKGDFKRVKSLVEQGHEINPRDNAGWIPLHEACNHGHYNIVEFLIEHGADVNSCGPGGMTPLHDAAWFGHFEIMRLLIKNGANVICLTANEETVKDKLLKFWREKNSTMTNSEISEYKQMEAELDHAMDRLGFNVINPKKSGTSSAPSSSTTTSIARAVPPVAPSSMDHRRVVQIDKRGPNVVGLNSTSVQHYRDAMSALKRKRPLDIVNEPNKRPSPPPIVRTNFSTSMPTKDWLLGDDVVEEAEDEDEEDDVKDDDVIPTILDHDDDDHEDDEVQEIPFSTSGTSRAEPRAESPFSLNSSRSGSHQQQQQSRSVSATPSELANQPISVTIEGRKMLIPNKRSSTIAELKQSVINRYSILLGNSAKPQISLAPADDPECILFDEDLCQDVISNSALVATIDSWLLDSIESTYLGECSKAGVEPQTCIKLEMRALDETDLERLDLAHLKFPRANLRPIIQALARRNFTSACFQGANWWFESQRIWRELLGTSCLFTWTKLTRLNLKCSGLMRCHFECLCQSKSKLPELQHMDLSVNLIVYKSEREFASELARLKRVCGRLKKLDLRKNHLAFAKTSPMDLHEIEILASDQCTYTIHSDA